eukprot:1788687-Prymnesium_polylepis.3
MQTTGHPKAVREGMYCLAIGGFSPGDSLSACTHVLCSESDFGTEWSNRGVVSTQARDTQSSLCQG